MVMPTTRDFSKISVYEQILLYKKAYEFDNYLIACNKNFDMQKIGKVPVGSLVDVEQPPYSDYGKIKLNGEAAKQLKKMEKDFIRSYSDRKFDYLCGIRTAEKQKELRKSAKIDEFIDGDDELNSALFTVLKELIDKAYDSDDNKKQNMDYIFIFLSKYPKMKDFVEDFIGSFLKELNENDFKRVYSESITSELIKNSNEKHLKGEGEFFKICEKAGVRSAKVLRKMIVQKRPKIKEKAYQTLPKTNRTDHLTGLAVDICFWRPKETEKLFEDNAYKYGFVKRYTNDAKKFTGIVDEPWHYRYVGEKHAKYIHQNKTTLDEYIMDELYSK